MKRWQRLAIDLFIAVGNMATGAVMVLTERFPIALFNFVMAGFLFASLAYSITGGE